MSIALQGGALALLILTSLQKSGSLSGAIRSTSLTSAASWGVAAHLAWMMSAAGSLFPANEAVLDQLWYGTAILSLCPWISVLGARRPTNRVWNTFIVFPLVAVLIWPALADWVREGELAVLRLQTPVILGVVLVLVMGTGNFLGTRFSVSACLAALAVSLVVLPLGQRWDVSPETIALCRGGGACCWAIGERALFRGGGAPVFRENRWDRVWRDFRDAFGMVWSLRIQERMNAMAAKEGWPCRIGPAGWEWDREVDQAARDFVFSRMDHAVRWHLRRFVDPEWIDRRIGVEANPEVIPENQNAD